METHNMSNMSYVQDPGPNQPGYAVAYEVVMALLCLVGILLDVLIIHVIFRYRRVHTVPNIFVANWALADIFVLVFFGTNYRLVEFFEKLYLPRVLEVFCYETEFIFRNTALLFVLAATLDWGLAAHSPRASARLRRHYAYLLGLIWLLNTAFMLTSLVLTLQEVYHMAVTLDYHWACYLSLALAVLGLQVTRLVKKLRKTPSDHPAFVLTLTTVLLLASTPYMLLLVVDVYGWFTLELTYLSTSVITFAMLYKNDQDFQACFQQATRCSRYRYVDDLADYRNFGKQRRKPGQADEDS